MAGNDCRKMETIFYTCMKKLLCLMMIMGIIGSHNFGLGSTLVSSEIAVEFYSKPIVKRLIEVFETEYNDRGITQIATLPFLEQEMKDYKTTINLLQKGFLKTMISEIY
jgi:phosphatidylserine/phosphatidylglycerophosphate/cardiolipin synthase-like enzyme